MQNRSAPVDTILPHVTYLNVDRAIRWLRDAFGFEEHYRYGPPHEPQGAQLHHGGAWIMLNAPRELRTSPAQIGHHTQSLTVFVTDVDAHYARAKSAGAVIVEELNETMYGERQYAAVDPEGHRWLFSQHVRDVDPAEWGAIVAAG
jgi:uncharacterized glyoxalase superfamily protein PhnB